MDAKKTVIIYVLELDDGKTTDERLVIAAKRYCAEYGLQMEIAPDKDIFRVAWEAVFSGASPSEGECQSQWKILGMCMFGGGGRY